jgi:hypothetical protein
MLTTLTYLSDQRCLGLPVSLQLPPPGKVSGIRKRGGQPGNTNAFRHGLYSGLYPPFWRTSTKPFPGPLDPSSPTGYLNRNARTALLLALSENRNKLAQIASFTKNGLSHKELISWLRAITMIVGRNVKIIKALHELGGRQEHLRSMVRNMHAHLKWEFNLRGIPASSAFVPHKLINLHANLGWELYHLPDGQWLHLKEIFVSLQIELDLSRTYSRRKQLPSARFLFEGIFWKLANSIRWQDLPGKYPVRLCQDLYSVLCRTGRLQIIYRQLWWHLNVFGESTLEALVDRGCFVINGNRVQLSPSEEWTWEKYTGLFLLQQAFRSRRSIQHEDSRERRMRGNFFRLPSRKFDGPNYRSSSPRHEPPLPYLTPLAPVKTPVNPVLGTNPPSIYRSHPANLFPLDVFHLRLASQLFGLLAPITKTCAPYPISFSASSFGMEPPHDYPNKIFCLKSDLVQSNILKWVFSFTKRTSRAPPIIDLDLSSAKLGIAILFMI